MQGYLLPDAFYTDPNQNLSASFTTDAIFFPTKDYIITNNEKGAVTRFWGQNTLHEAKLGFLQGSYFDDFYNRIYIHPANINVGRLVSNQYRQVEVWNAYIENRKLIEIKTQGTDGILLTGEQPPATWAPLSSKLYDLTVTKDGPPTIDATYAFEWDNGDLNYLKITGSRIVNFPIPYGAPSTETLEWLTDVLTSNDGTEQRIQLRLTPRQAIDSSYPISRQNIKTMQNLVYGWLDRTYAVPLWTQSQRVSVVNSGNVINVDTRYGAYALKGLVHVWQSANKQNIYEIESLTSNSITTTTPIEEDYKNALVMPVVLADMTGEPTISGNLDEGYLKTGYLVNNNPFVTETVPAQYKGNDLYLDQLLMPDDGVEDVYFKRIDTIDNETGSPVNFSPWKHTRTKRTVLYETFGLEEMRSFLGFLYRRCGRLRPFWQPTFAQDLKLVYQDRILEELRIVPESYTQYAKDRKNLVFWLKDGTSQIREVFGINDISNDLALLTLNTSLNLSTDQISYVSFLGLKRFSQDRVELVHETGGRMTCQLIVEELEP